MINLTLLHPTQLAPVQYWGFESESLIRIGRARDNDVIVYSAVVSRHHVELWEDSSGWIVINFGANGTYVGDEPIIQTSVVDGMIIRLGSSGPKLQILTEKLIPRFAETGTNLSQSKLALMNRNYLHKIVDKNADINQDVTQTDFD